METCVAKLRNRTAALRIRFISLYARPRDIFCASGHPIVFVGPLHFHGRPRDGRHRPCLATLDLGSLTLFVAAIGPAIDLDVPAFATVVTLHMAPLVLVFIRNKGSVFDVLVFGL